MEPVSVRRLPPGPAIDAAYLRQPQSGGDWDSGGGAVRGDGSMAG